MNFEAHGTVQIPETCTCVNCNMAAQHDSSGRLHKHIYFNISSYLVDYCLTVAMLKLDTNVYIQIHYSLIEACRKENVINIFGLVAPELLSCYIIIENMSLYPLSSTIFSWHIFTVMSNNLLWTGSVPMIYTINKQQYT